MAFIFISKKLLLSFSEAGAANFIDALLFSLYKSQSAK
ncbi:hypothetical protein BSBH6_03719 [Bacillus subtilis]|nr:hypothetical protein BSBH6_03719 [Bacillus subtilis]RPK20679.1 hypothetical protein BH5_03896 [Bacillus subtilis]